MTAKQIKKMKEELVTLKDMFEYSFNDPNQTEEVIKRNKNLFNKIVKLEKKLSSEI